MHQQRKGPSKFYSARSFISAPLVLFLPLPEAGLLPDQYLKLPASQRPFAGHEHVVLPNAAIYPHLFRALRPWQRDQAWQPRALFDEALRVIQDAAYAGRAAAVSAEASAEGQGRGEQAGVQGEEGALQAEGGVGMGGKGGLVVEELGPGQGAGGGEGEVSVCGGGGGCEGTGAGAPAAAAVVDDMELEVRKGVKVWGVRVRVGVLWFVGPEGELGLGLGCCGL